MKGRCLNFEAKSSDSQLMRKTLLIGRLEQPRPEVSMYFYCASYQILSLERMIQYKEKSERYREQATVGLFTYPALMAADILLYQTDCVPVGEDQKQHVELTRDLAQRFNYHFGQAFKVPEVVMPPVAARVMGLDTPGKKMSKSESAWGHAVGVLDSPDDIIKKFKSAKTDSGATIAFNPEQEGVYNLLTIYQAFSGKPQAEILNHFAGKMYGHLKLEVAELVVESLKPLQSRYAEISRHPDELDRLLAQGRESAVEVAEKTLKHVHELTGLG